MEGITEDRQRVAALLRGFRKAARMTQADLASRLGEPQSFVSKIESGERRVDLAELKVICSALGTTLSAFLERFEGEVDER